MVFFLGLSLCSEIRRQMDYYLMFYRLQKKSEKYVFWFLLSLYDLHILFFPKGSIIHFLQPHLQCCTARPAWLVGYPAVLGTE